MDAAEWAVVISILSALFTFAGLVHTVRSRSEDTHIITSEKITLALRELGQYHVDIMNLRSDIKYFSNCVMSYEIQFTHPSSAVSRVQYYDKMINAHLERCLSLMNMSPPIFDRNVTYLEGLIGTVGLHRSKLEIEFGNLKADMMEYGVPLR